MSFLNAVLRRVFDLILLPFQGLPPIVGVAVVSAVGGIGALMVYKLTSNQEALARVKDQIAASFFEIRLFNDDMFAILRAQWDLLRNNLRYMGLNLVPMAWMIVPFFLVIAQLQFHYGYEGLTPGRTALLSVALEEETATRPEIALELPEGLRLDSPAVWSPALGEVAWRIVPEREGQYELGLTVSGEKLTKSLRVDTRPVRRSPARLRGTFLNQLLYPAETPLPADSAVHSINISYPEAEIDALFFSTHWMVVFLVLSIAFAWLMRKRLGVTL